MQQPEYIDCTALSPSSLQELLDRYQIRLTIDELETIQHTFLQRPPTLAECILWSIQGSEHCSYKSTRPFLKQFKTSGPHVILGAKEDAGIIRIAEDLSGHRYGLVVSHESHNHPSQIVPYEGAATGVGGNVRDVSCMGAEVIALADGLRFGSLDHAKTHFIQEGVVSGIAGYGNPIGVPTIAGDVYYHPGYNDNCLVTVVTLGIVREDQIIHSYVPAGAKDHVFILVGKPTDQSGFGGASFASTELLESEQEANKGAVQEPNAFLLRHLLKANLALFKKLVQANLINQVGFKDLGAGGIACASVELAETGGFGAEIYLDAVPQALSHLDPAVVLCSETQERFMWVVPEELKSLILDHYNVEFALPQVSAGAMASEIGKVREDGQYIVYNHGQKIIDASAKDITKGLVYNRPHVKKAVAHDKIQVPAPKDYNDVLLNMLAHENIASKAPIFEKYDKQVQGRTVIEAGEADAGVIQPFNSDDYPEEIRATGVALSLDQNPRFNEIDAYFGAVNAVCEAVRNVTAVGAVPLAITDCLCFGNPEKPEQMQDFIDAVRGIIDTCASIKTLSEATLPVIAGNVSLYNESSEGAIPGSPMIACVGTMPDVRFAVTMAFKQPDSNIILVGARKDEMGGSLYNALHQTLGVDLPQPDLQGFNQEITAVREAIQQGLVLASHDIADGGLAVTLAEMTFANQIGAEIKLSGHLPLHVQLFAETGGFVLEVANEKMTALKTLFEARNVSVDMIGKTKKDPSFRVNDVVDLTVAFMKGRWCEALRKKII